MYKKDLCKCGPNNIDIFSEVMFYDKTLFYTDLLLMRAPFPQKTGFSSLGDNQEEGIDVSRVVEHVTGDNCAV